MPPFFCHSDSLFERHRKKAVGWLAMTSNRRGIRNGFTLLIGTVAVTSSIAHGCRQNMGKIVFHYYSNDPTHNKSFKSYDNGELNHWEYTVRKPRGIPGSRNYIWQFGAETNRVYEINKLEVRNGIGKILYVSWNFTTWAAASTASIDYYYLMTDPQASDAALLDSRNRRLRRINPDASANVYSFPYSIIVISRTGIRKFACTFDKSVFTAPNEKKILASPTGQGRPQGTIDMIMRRLSEHGARMKADRCRRYK